MTPETTQPKNLPPRMQLGGAGSVRGRSGWRACHIARSFPLTPALSPGKAWGEGASATREIMLSTSPLPRAQLGGAGSVRERFSWRACPGARSFPLTPALSPGKAWGEGASSTREIMLSISPLPRAQRRADQANHTGYLR